MNFDSTFRTDLSNCKQYVPSETQKSTQASFQFNKAAKLDANENPYGPYSHARQAMIRSVSHLNRYPEDDFLKIKSLIASQFDLKPENVAIGSGAGNILENLAKEFLDTGNEVLIAKQSYRLYREISKMMGAKVIEIPLTTDYQFDLDKFQRNITKNTKIIWICNPNNPTSTVTDSEKLEKFISSLPEDIWVIVDEAYADFSDKKQLPDLLKYIGMKRVIIVRTFSKYYGLAGARLGYALADKKVIQGYDTITEPFSCSRVALAGASASLKFDQDQAKTCLGKILSDRVWVSDQLEQLHFKVADSQTNFIFAELLSKKGNFNLRKELLKEDVIVNDGTSWGYPNHIRVTIGTHYELERFINKVKIILSRFAEKTQ